MSGIWLLTQVLTITAEKRVTTRFQMPFHFHKISPAFPLIQSCTFFFGVLKWNVPTFSPLQIFRHLYKNKTQHNNKKQSILQQSRLRTKKKNCCRKMSSLVFKLQWGQSMLKSVWRPPRSEQRHTNSSSSSSRCRQPRVKRRQMWPELMLSHASKLHGVSQKPEGKFGQFWWLEIQRTSAKQQHKYNNNNNNLPHWLLIFKCSETKDTSYIQNSGLCRLTKVFISNTRLDLKVSTVLMLTPANNSLNKDVQTSRSSESKDQRLYWSEDEEWRSRGGVFRGLTVCLGNGGASQCPINP